MVVWADIVVQKAMKDYKYKSYLLVPGTPMLPVKHHLSPGLRMCLENEIILKIQLKLYRGPT